MKFRSVFIVFLLFQAFPSFSQNKRELPSKKWFVSIAGGVQMSGIKPEDFISQNVAPLFNFSAGIWVTQDVALQIGYKGIHFNTIADKDKHPYNFTYGEVLLNVSRMLSNNKDSRKWNLILHPGAGIFNNMYYGRPNVCFNIGMINSLSVAKHIDLFIDLSFIAGWDIYQGNDDILPNLAMGITYSFK